MNTGAHPDDETTPMLAAMALRDGVKVSHACSTRGEGGQNALGTETEKDLGTIRTREMERAAAVLGMTQYWLSEMPDDTIFDFGFSKSGAETLGKWGEERTVKRFVQILRCERPDIICPTFLDIPGQHGHHRAMTRTAFKAVELAADPSAFAELDLPVWQVKKLYLPAWSGAGDAYDDDVPPPPATVTFDATGADPIMGADYAQIAQWSRGFHKTQAMGHWVASGQPSVWPLHLAWVANGDTGKESSILDGLPVSLAGLSGYAGAPELAEDLGAAGAAIDAAIAAFPGDAETAKSARQALNHISKAYASCPPSAAGEVLHRLVTKRRQLAQVIALASDLRASLDFSEYDVRPGDTFTADLNLYSQGLDLRPHLHLPDGWTATDWKDGQCQITLGQDAPVSDPYPDTWFPDRPNSPVSVTLTWQDGDHLLEQPLDPLVPLNVLPKYSAVLSNNQAILRLPDLEPITIEVSDIHPKGAAISATCPDGWKVAQDGTTITFMPLDMVKPGPYEFGLSLDGTPASTIHRMQYDHTGVIYRSEPAVMRILALDVMLPNGRIAYIGGGSDLVDQLLRNIGVQIDSIAEADLANINFDSYDTILVGIFAFRTRPALSDRLDDLHSWITSGGNLVTLYHRPWDNWEPSRTPPAHLKIGKPSLRWRVTDENAEVTHLNPDHALLNTPNTIGPDDWAGWQKERGLYFASEWDAVYEPLLSMADPGEEPLIGSLLSAKIGAGRHTHTGLILHHQMPKMVPGSYRLLANLLMKPAKNALAGEVG